MSASAGLPSGKSAAEIDRFGRDPMGRARRKTPDRVSGFRVPVPGKSSRELAGWAGLRLRESAKSTDGLDNGRILAALEAPRASHPSGERWGVRRRSGSPSRPRGIRRSIRNETGRAVGESVASSPNEEPKARSIPCPHGSSRSRCRTRSSAATISSSSCAWRTRSPAALRSTVLAAVVGRARASISSTTATAGASDRSLIAAHSRT